MPSDFYFKTASNYNDVTGGGGCLASGRAASEDCEGPWFLFFRVSTEHDESPHATICEKHLRELWESRHFVDELAAKDELALRNEAKRERPAEKLPVGVARQGAPIDVPQD